MCPDGIPTEESWGEHKARILLGFVVAPPVLEDRVREGWAWLGRGMTRGNWKTLCTAAQTWPLFSEAERKVEPDSNTMQPAKRFPYRLQ